MDVFGYLNTASRSLPIVAKGLTDKQIHEIDLDRGKRCKVKVTPFLNGEITYLKVRRTLYLVTCLILDEHYMIWGFLTISSTLWSLPAFCYISTLKLWKAGCVVWDNVKMHHKPHSWRTGCGFEADRLPLLHQTCQSFCIGALNVNICVPLKNLPKLRFSFLLRNKNGT